MDRRTVPTELGPDTGAVDPRDRGAVAHTQVSTTARYSRGALGKSRMVAQMRNAHRAAKNVTGTE